MNEMQKQVNYNYTNDKNLCFETMAVQIKSEPDNISEDNLIHQRNQNSQETCSSLENSYMQISSEKIKVEPGLTNKEQDNIGLKLSTKASFMFSGSKNKTSNNSYTSEEGMEGHDSDYEVDSNDNLDSESELPQQHIQNSGMKGGLRGLRGQQTNVIMTRQRTADDNFPEEPNIDFINQSGGQKEHKELSLDKIFEEVRQNLINAGVAKETIPVPSSSTRVQKTVLQRKTAKAVAEFNRLQKSGTPSINSSEISEPVPSKKKSTKLQKTSIPNTISEDSPEVYTGEKRYSCNICGKGFYYKSHLRKHCGIHLGIKPYTCNICGKGFNQNSNMKTHMRTHADKKPFNCNLCDKGFNHNSSLQIHLRTHTGERPFVCKFCNKGFSRNNTLKIHEATHSEIKPYACTMCDKTFGRRYVLQRHVMTHTGEKPYTCSTCGRAFSQNGDLQKHIRTHTGERPFSCPICGRGFIQNGDMLKHKKTHKNDKGNKTHTHVCKHCQKVFKSNDDLEEHMKEHDDLKEHMKEHDNVDEHMKEHYDGVRFICTTCGDEFIDIEDFQRHKRIHDAELLHSIHKVRDSVQKEENAAMNTGSSPKALCGTSGKIPENFVKSGGKVITDQCLELFMNPRTDDTMEIVETGLKLDRIIAEVKQNLMSGLQFKKDKERHGVIESNDEKMDMNEKDIAYEQPIDIHGDDQNEAEASSEDDDDNSEENLLDSTNASQLVSSTVDLTQDESPRGTTCTGNKSEKPFICTECGNGYNQIGTLRNHMKKHSGERPHICETCGKDFRLHRDLNRHMKIHSSDKPFTCETCGKEFKWRWDLQKHTMIHTGEKPHICSICGKGFRQNCILQAHIRTHTGEKPYVCTTCGKGFCQSTDLQKHMRTHTGEKLYFCETCGKGFSLRYNLRKHMQMHDRNLSKLCTTVTEDL